MSGQPSKTQSDVNKKRNEYMENLALQDEINDMNLQANKTYLLSGQLPPQSQMQDTRTTSEKLKDIEGLKQKIASDFAGTIDSTSVYSLINKIIDSPLNLNNSLFRFFAQRASSISEQYKKIYPLGIEGDANDVARIYEYIKNMYSDTQGKFQSTKSYMNSQYSGGSSRIIGANDLDVLIVQIDDIIKNIVLLSQRDINAGILGNSGIILQELRNLLLNFKQQIPNTEEFQQIVQDITNNIHTILNRGDFEFFVSFIEKLPKYNEVYALCNKITQYLRSNDISSVINGVIKLREMFSEFYNIENLRSLQQFNDNISRPIKQDVYRQHSLESIQQIQQINAQNIQREREAKAQRVYIVNPENDAVFIRNPNLLNSTNTLTQGAIAGTTAGLTGLALSRPQINQQEPEHGVVPYENTNQEPEQIFKNLGLYSLGERLYNTLDNQYYTITSINKNRYTLETDEGEEIKLNKDKLDRLFTSDNLPQLSYYNEPQQFIDNNFYIPPQVDYGNIKQIGKGLKRRGRPIGSGIIEKPDLRKKANFIGFGINEINQKKLNKGLVKIRRSTKTNYMDMPTRRVSSNLQGILKTIVGGGVPNYNDLGKLDDEEKSYLNKLISRSELTDRISVPAPSKDQQEKDIHNFEVMKGQIMSGNDSQELVKKFKLLIRRLSKLDLLPKADVDDLNDLLTDLGY